MSSIHMLIKLIFQNLWTTVKGYQQFSIAESFVFKNNYKVMSYGRFYNSKWTETFKIFVVIIQKLCDVCGQKLV